MSAIIQVRFTAPGWHCWPSAPAHRSYLASEHRHLFHVEVGTEVRHDDREIEFHDLRDEAKLLFSELGDGAGRMGAMSCEMMARAIGDRLSKVHRRQVTVTVSEDGEFAATVVCLPNMEKPRGDSAGHSKEGG